jgi:hypothetical protein
MSLVTRLLITEELIAQACHEQNRVWCQALGDTSQVAWADAPEWQKQSVIAGVKFLSENPGAELGALHEEWRKAKLADGWVYGDAKDETKKTHPCLVDWDKLPETQRVKDYLFSMTTECYITLLSELEFDDA